MRKERRKHLRLPLNFKVKLELPRRELVLGGHTLNLSFSGAFIKLDHIPSVLPNEYFSLILMGQGRLNLPAGSFILMLTGLAANLILFRSGTTNYSKK